MFRCERMVGFRSRVFGWYRCVGGLVWFVVEVRAFGGTCGSGEGRGTRFLYRRGGSLWCIGGFCNCSGNVCRSIVLV